MRSLLRSELARLLARPLVWCVAAAVLLGTAALTATAWWQTRPPTAQEVADAQVAYTDALAEWQVVGSERIEQCHEAQAQERAASGDPDLTFECDLIGPVLEGFLPYRPDVMLIVLERAGQVGALAGLGALMIGTGLVTSDFRSGAVSTWLTFEPRRGRVLAARSAVALLAAAVVTLGAWVVLGVGAWAVCALNGVPPGPSTGLAWVLPVVARWYAVCVGAAAVGAGLAFAVRHAAAVTGIAVWWFAAVETALPQVLPAARPATLAANLGAWTDGEYQYDVPRCVPDATAPGGEICERVWHTVSGAQGGAVLASLVVVALVLGWVSFRWRDVP